MKKIKLKKFSQAVQKKFKHLASKRWGNNYKNTMWNTLRTIIKKKKQPNKFPFKNDYKEKSTYSGRDAISFTGGKDSVAAAILSKEIQGESPILLVTKSTIGIKKIAEKLGSEIIEFPYKKFFYPSIYFLAPYYLQNVDYSGRILIGTEIEDITNLFYYAVWDEGLQAYTKYCHNKYDLDVDFMSITSSLSNTGNLFICKSKPEIAKYLNLDKGGKYAYLEILTKSLGVKCKEHALYSLGKKDYIRRLKKETREYFKQELEQALYIITNSEHGKKYNWINKINEIERYGHKSRKKVNKYINEEIGLKYNSDIPQIFKRRIWN